MLILTDMMLRRNMTERIDGKSTNQIADIYFIMIATINPFSLVETQFSHVWKQERVNEDGS